MEPLALGTFAERCPNISPTPPKSVMESIVAFERMGIKQIMDDDSSTSDAAGSTTVIQLFQIPGNSHPISKAEVQTVPLPA